MMLPVPLQYEVCKYLVYCIGNVIEALNGPLLRGEVTEDFTIRRDQTSCKFVHNLEPLDRYAA